MCRVNDSEDRGQSKAKHVHKAKLDDERQKERAVAREEVREYAACASGAPVVWKIVSGSVSWRGKDIHDLWASCTHGARSWLQHSMASFDCVRIGYVEGGTPNQKGERCLPAIAHDAICEPNVGVTKATGTQRAPRLRRGGLSVVCTDC